MILNYNIYNMKRFKMISLKIRVFVLPGLANVPAVPMIFPCTAHFASVSKSVLT